MVPRKFLDFKGISVLRRGILSAGAIPVVEARAADK
jgi:hypothetical protein